MGMPRVWLDIAEEIGVDSFLAMWRRLDREQGFRNTQRFMIEVDIRPYKSYLKFQRNRYIETLAASGRRPEEIRAALHERLGETVSTNHIYRLLREA